MSFRGGGRGGFNRGGGFSRGGSNNHFRGGGVLGEFLHPCEDDIVCKCTTDENKVPYFNAPVYLENKEQIGKVDEIFGQLRDFYFSVKLSENMKASSFKKLQKFYIDPYKLLPLQRFLPRPPGEKGPPRGGGRGGRGGGRGGGGRGGRGGKLLVGKIPSEISKLQPIHIVNLTLYIGKLPLCLFYCFRKAIFKSCHVAIVIMLSFNNL
ncbi:H/ACA ribonucleoprotein complex subunit 1 isoform X3 [Suricata suricatta]|uniref:H/ACA ribonucleoprotein complex subunit 1 isoform X3 n=1 Tax=Suricata suricatta TaxID=37032 RepID=UPI00115586FD|nr:H/ACA ribonucleoprotein complex subunit 1 isoform X3 [Suricata suricatta]